MDFKNKSAFSKKFLDFFFPQPFWMLDILFFKIKFLTVVSLYELFDEMHTKWAFLLDEHNNST